MRTKISVQKLQFGMYIDELDCQWVDTPFLFQGFPLQTEQELIFLQRYCDYVYVYERTDSHKSNNQALDHRFQTSQINISSPAPKNKNKHGHRELVDEIKIIKKTYDQSHSYIIKVLNDVRLGNNINVSSAKTVVSKMTDSIIKNESALMLLSQLKQYDEYTIRHSLNVCIISLLFGKHLGLSSEDMNVLGLGALLHDIGKMKLPADILNKPGKLNEEELKIIQEHPENGYQLLVGKGEMPYLALETVRSHHERIDGSGYPRKLKKGQINQFSMLVSIVDTYDAITTKRAYHDGISPHEALRLMYESEIGAFPQELLDSFIQCLSIFPIGSIVELDDGNIGIVMSINHHKHLFPIVLLVLDKNKCPYYPRKVCDLELRNKQGSPLKVRKILESNAYGLNATRILFEEGDFEALELLD